MPTVLIQKQMPRGLKQMIKFKNSSGQVQFVEKDDGTIEIYDEKIYDTFKKEGYTNIILVKRSAT